MDGKTHALALEKRRKIYNYILENPGTHLRELSRKIDVPITTLNYHIHYLKKKGLITENIEENYSRFYASNKIGSNDKKLLKLIRKEIPRNILLVIISNYCASRMDISRELELHPNTVDFHLKKLVKIGIIGPAETNGEGVCFTYWKKPRVLDRKPICNEVIYSVKDPVYVVGVFLTYKKSLINDTVSKYLWDYFNSETIYPHPKKYPTFDSMVDSTLNLFFEYFPYPFCA